jgi:hypothetical protein
VTGRRRDPPGALDADDEQGDEAGDARQDEPDSGQDDGQEEGTVKVRAESEVAAPGRNIGLSVAKGAMIPERARTRQNLACGPVFTHFGPSSRIKSE